MQCPECRFTNPAEARFCGQCGNPMSPAAAPSVAATLGSVFCPECGVTGELENGRCQSCGRVWQTPAVPAAGWPAPAGIAGPSTEIPPKTLAGLVTDTLLLYRRHFWLFFPVALVPQIPSLAGLADLTVAQELLVAVMVFIPTAIAQGVLVHSAATIYFGRPASIEASLRRAVSLVLPLLFAQVVWTLLLLGSALLSLALVGIPLFLLILVFLVFYPQAIIIERFTYVSAFNRSAALVKGHGWRVLGVEAVYLLSYVVPVVILYLLASPQVFAVGSIVLAALGMPWLALGMTLLYFDLRVRKEGFSPDTLAGELQDNSER